MITLENKLRAGLANLSDYATLIRSDGFARLPTAPVPLLLEPTVAGVLFHELIGHSEKRGGLGFRLVLKSDRRAYPP